MSDQDKPNDGSLMPAGRRDLAPVAAANPLVSRGISDLAQARLVKASEGIRLAMEKAILCHLAGELDEAVRHYDEAIRLDPNHFFANLNRGRAWLRKGNYDNAIKDFDATIGLEPDHASAYAQRGATWFCKKDYHKAITDFDEAIRLYSEVENDDLDDNDGRSDEAIRIWTADVYYGRGNAWAAKGDLARAISDFDQAIRLDPNNPNWYWRRAELYDECDYHDKASKDRNEASRLDRRERTLAVPHKLDVNIPGVLSVQFTRIGISVTLAETPGIIEISSTTLAKAHERLLFERKQRLDKLRALNAPAMILQNEIHILNLCKDAWKKTNRPEDYAYQFKAKGEHFSRILNGVSNLAALTQLETLDLSACSVTDNAIAQLHQLANLRVLRLGNCVEITDEGLVHLAALTELETLDLSGCSVTDQGLAHLCGLKNLHKLGLSACDKVTEAGIAALKAALPECEIE